MQEKKKSNIKNSDSSMKVVDVYIFTLNIHLLNAFWARTHPFGIVLLYFLIRFKRNRISTFFSSEDPKSKDRHTTLLEFPDRKSFVIHSFLTLNNYGSLPPVRWHEPRTHALRMLPPRKSDRLNKTTNKIFNIMGQQTPGGNMRAKKKVFFTVQ